MTRRKSGLASNPLQPAGKSIFEKTIEPEPPTEPAPEAREQLVAREQQEKRLPEAKVATVRQEPMGRSDAGERTDDVLPLAASREKINLRLPTELSYWLDDLVRRGRRRHGRKIPKEVWLQAALELMRRMPVSWEELDSEDALRDALESLVKRLPELKA